MQLGLLKYIVSFNAIMSELCTFLFFNGTIVRTAARFAHYNIYATINVLTDSTLILF